MKQGQDGNWHQGRSRIHDGWEADEDEPDVDHHAYYEASDTFAATENDDGFPEEPRYSSEEIEAAEQAFAAQQRRFDWARELFAE
eukprot:2840207-Pyramimonas_sp.AAC.1